MAQVKTKRAPRAQNNSNRQNSGAAPESKHESGHVGDVLRGAREERGISLEMVADELMIRRFYLDALEKGSFGDLPERVYAMGFVKNYANYLGLDAKALMEQFKRNAYARQDTTYQVTLNMPEPVAHSVSPNRSAILAGIAILVVVLGGVVWSTQKDKAVVDVIPEPTPIAETVPDIADIPVPSVNNNEAAAMVDESAPAPTRFIGAESAAENSVESAPISMEQSAEQNDAAPNAEPVIEQDETAQITAPSAASDNTSAAAPAPIVNVKNHRVLEAVHASWVEVRDEKNTILFTSILKKGQILPLPDNVRLTVTTGNAGGLRLLIDGKPQAVFGQPSEVKRNIVIAPRPLDRH